jgi:hypothetical protein
MESSVDFEAVDFPQANRLTIHILAAVAEHEARMISERANVPWSSCAALPRSKRQMASASQLPSHLDGLIT